MFAGGFGTGALDDMKFAWLNTCLPGKPMSDGMCIAKMFAFRGVDVVVESWLGKTGQVLKW